MLSQLLLPTFFAILARSQNDANTQHTLTINTTAPDSAIHVPPNFFSFGFETAWLDNFCSDFSGSLIKSIGARMSKPMILRIGGTSGDLVRVNESQTESKTCIGGTNCPHNSKDTFMLGPSYFDGFKCSSFSDTHMTFQAPVYPHWESDTWLNESMKYVRHAANALGHERMAAIALGNEPDYYGYGQKEYINRSLALERRIIEELGLTGDHRRIFELGDIPNSVIETRDNGDWGLVNLFKNELNSNGFGKFAAQHYYQISVQEHASGPDDLQELLMNHTAITDRFPIIERNIKSVHEDDGEMAFVLSEVGSAIGETPSNFSSGFGAALWAVDFHLASMSRGVKRISNTMRPESTHSFWIPDNSGGKPTVGPSVQGLFIAAPFVTDFVGNGSLGQVVEVEVPGKPDLFSAYAMYSRDSAQLQRVALINLRQWYPDLSDNRGHAVFTLELGSAQSATVRRMHSERGVFAVGFDQGGPEENVTWAGEQWAWNVDKGQGHFPRGLEEETVKSSNGKIEVTVPNSEAVIVFFD